MSDCQYPPPLERFSKENSVHNSFKAQQHSFIRSKYKYCPEDHKSNVEKCIENSTNFSDSNDLSENSSAYYSPPPIPSIVCNITVIQNSNIRKSIKTPKKRKRAFLQRTREIWKCDKCHKSFTRRCSLTNHKKLHTPALLHRCTHCSKGFTRKDHMLRHTRIHTGEKPFECDICHKRFYRKDYLSKHLKTYHRVEKVQCTLCKKSVLQNTELLEHMQIMHSAKGIEKRRKEKKERMKNAIKINTKKVKKSKKEKKKNQIPMKLDVELNVEEINTNDREIDDSYANLVNNNRRTTYSYTYSPTYFMSYSETPVVCKHSRVDPHRPCLLCNNERSQSVSYINSFPVLPPPPPPTNANILFSSTDSKIHF